MSKIIFHSKSLSEDIDKFCKEYEQLPDKQRPIIIMTLDEFSKSAHVKMSSPLSIVSSIIGVMSLFNKDITITIPWDKSVYNAFNSYDTDDVSYEIWMKEKNEFKIDNEEINIVNELNVEQFKDRIIYIDCMYIMCSKTIKMLNAHKDQVRETKINQKDVIDSFNIRDHMTRNTQINLTIPQLYSSTWSEYMNMIIHFIESNKDRVKFICVESLEDDDMFIQLMNNMFKPYKNTINIVNAHTSCVKSIRLD